MKEGDSVAQKRINISLSDKLLQYFENRAAESGQALAAVVGLALLEFYEYKETQKGMSSLTGLMELANQDKKRKVG